MLIYYSIKQIKKPKLSRNLILLRKKFQIISELLSKKNNWNQHKA